MGHDLPCGADDRKAVAKYIAAVVRDAMEDFHSRHLSNEQMAQLNPLIRNAIYTALYTLDSVTNCDASARFMEEHAKRIPSYWEAPVLLPAFQKMLERRGKRGPF